MKDYIYLDTDLLNSTLAQLDEGLLNGFSEGNEQGKINSSGSEKHTSKGLEGVFQVGAKYVKEFTESTSLELTNTQSKALDYVLNDYAVDILLDKIKELDNFNNFVSVASEGDYVHFTSFFKLFDFQMLKKITNEETINLLFEDDSLEIQDLEKKINLLKAQKGNSAQFKKELKEKQDLLKEAKRKAKENKEGINTMHKAASFADNILGGSIFVQTSDSLSLCKRECFRLSQGQLTMLAESKRDLTVLGLVSSIKEDTHIDGNFNDFKANDLNKIPSMFTDLFMSNFNLIHNDDRVITPIALFFE